LSFSLKLEDWVDHLVRPSASASPGERARLENFILRRILSSFALVVAASICLAVQTAPTVSDALTLLWLIVPLGALTLSPAAGLVPVEALSSVSFIAAGSTAAMGAGALHQTALAWFILAPIESIFSRNGILVAVTGILAAFAALLLEAQGPSVASADPAFLLVPAIAFATMVGTGIISLRTSHRDVEPQTGRSDTLGEPIGSLVIWHDRLGAAISVSPNCESLFGLAPSELLGRGFFEHVHVADRPAFLKALSDAGLGSTPVNTSLRWRGSARVDRGNYAEPVFIWLDMHARRSGNPSHAGGNGKSGDGVIAVFRDVTEAKLREATFDAARTGAKEANIAQDLFLAHVGHELRTPLNAIVGFSELLGNPQLAPVEPDKQREYAGIIHQSGQHLLALVNSILDMSKIQSGSFAIERERFVMAPLIDLCCDMLKLQAKDKGVELLRAYPENCDEITGDKRVCKQIIINLLSNAVKFTPPGGSVTIGATVEADALAILVVDTGIGIAARDLAHLGDPFFQAQAAPDRKDAGTGLGLSIVRGLVGLQGGTITVASEPGKGTCVIVRLPLDCSGFKGKTGTSAEIKTLARLPFHDDKHQLCKQMTVKKIA
jgi:two-component system, cell cycle sensor histidine kinase DivJ